MNSAKVAPVNDPDLERSGTIRAETGPRSPNYDGKIRELDGLRGLAISFVLLSHLTFPIPSVQRVISNGWIGVDLFFVLSGYLITGVLLRGKQTPHYYRNFYARRALRILPAYYLVLVAACAGSVGNPTMLKWGSRWWFVFFLANFRQALLSFWPSPALFVPLWSLQVEEQFYLLFPFFVRNLRVGRLWKVLVAIVLAVLALRTSIVWWGHASPALPFVLTICRADSLAMGALVAVFLHNRRPPKFGWWLDAVVVLGFAVLFSSPLDCYGAFSETLGYTLIAIFFAIVLLWMLSRIGQAPTAIFRRGPLPWLGVISYGLYLWHEFVYSPLDLKFNSVGLDTLIQFVRLAGAIGLGMASWHFIEKPFLKRKEQFR
jgi:peptidoglycan/LPS O-acetylase OafA/YrhL